VSGSDASQVAAVVVNWNGRGDCEAGLGAVISQSLVPAEVVVVDNGSSDGSCAWFERQPGVRVLRNPQNLGFARAVNQGLAASTCPLVLLCNLDCVLDPGYLAAAVLRLESDPKIGSVGGRLRQGPNPSSPLDTAGHLLHRSGWVANRGRGESGAGRYLVAEEVFGVSAAAALYRRQMLDDIAIGGEVFCEAFFAYLEDVDLDWRARWRGWRCYYEPAATASHRRGGTGLSKSALIERHVVANRISLLARNAPPSWLRGRRGASAAGFIALRFGLALGRHPTAVLGIVDAGRRRDQDSAARAHILGTRLVDDATIDRWALPTPWRSLLGAHLGIGR
jgi:GT2 family glycosyltransferase